MKSLSLRELEELLRSGKTFVLYVRSEEKKSTIREIFDTDIVVPELEKFFTLDFYRINAEENPEILKRYRLPSLVLFSGGREVRVLEGIKTWNEYLGALSCL